MKVFFIWLALACFVFGGISAGYHVYLNKNPRKILIAVDTAYPMKKVWNKIPDLLKSFSDKPYTQYALITEKNRIHRWASKLETGKLTPYAPRDLSKLIDENFYPEIKEADRAVFLTNAPESETQKLGKWEIVRVQ